MKTTIRSTNEQLTKLIKFRQTVYEQGLGCGRDALFELIDAVVERPTSQCLAEMSLSAQFRRGWSSVYKAVERGGVKPAALAQLFVAQVPLTGIQVYPLDSTVWAHPAARTLTGLVYAPSPTKALKHHSLVQGHEYSLLGWTTAVRQSWTPTLTVERVPATGRSVTVGVTQVEWLWQQRQRLGATALDVIVADGHYGNPAFLGPLRHAPCALLVRLRRDRVLYGPPPTYAGRGRPRKHGAPFAFKRPDTWGTPVESCEFADERWGQVRLRRWDNLHDQQDVATAFSVICAEVQRTHANPPAPLWLGYKPGHTEIGRAHV